ncbi:MAG: hypothetical protein AAB581_00260 [Patescibacteria group bacterium]|mgnify:CR=1 FL=1
MNSITRIGYGKGIVLAALVLAPVFALAAWVDAPAGPPNYGPTPPYTQADFQPMNLGTTDQAKLGDIGANRFNDSEDSAFFIDPKVPAVSSSGNLAGSLTVGSLCFGGACRSSWTGGGGGSIGGWTLADPDLYAESTNYKVGIGTTVLGAKLTVNNPQTAGKIGSSGDGIYAYANNTNAAVSAEQADASGYAVYASGRSYFNGITRIGDTQFWDNEINRYVPNSNLYLQYRDASDNSNNDVGNTIINPFSGNVGIGTVGPRGTLELAGTATAYNTIFNYKDDSSEDTYIRGGKATSRVRIGDNNTGDILLESAGRVGIGTSGPGAKLHVSGGAIRVQSSTFPQVEWTDGTKGYNVYYNPPSNALTFQPWGVGNLVVEGGNVGIGVPNPGYKLDVAGDANATQLCIGGDCRNAWPGGGGTPTLQAVTDQVGGNITTNTIYANGFYDSEDSAFFIDPKVPAVSSSGRLAGSFAVEGGLAVYGDVGIGTETPSARLAVTGTLTTPPTNAVVAIALGGPFSDTNNWEGRTMRQVISGGVLNNPDGITEVRVTFRASSTQWLTITDAYIGMGSPVVDLYDFAQPPTRLTFQGGLNSFTFPPGSFPVSDWVFIPASIPAGSSIVISVYTTNSPPPIGTSGYSGINSLGGWQGFYKPNVNDAATVDATSYVFDSSVIGVFEITERIPGGATPTEVFTVSENGDVGIKQSIVLNPLAGDPASPVNGQIWMRQ